MSKNHLRFDAFKQLLLALEQVEGHPLSVYTRDACYIISVNKEIVHNELFIVSEDQKTPWETFERDIRKSMKYVSFLL